MARGVIVSFTSMPSRIGRVHFVIDGLLSQTVLPERIVLYLSKADFPGLVLPRSLTTRLDDRFSIRWLDSNLRSYRKLVHALSDFPDKSIITVDDDQLYSADAIESLVTAARRFPGHIAFRIGYRLGPRDPLTGSIPRAGREPDLWHLPVGVGGVLYPPDSLHGEVGNSDLFMSLCPYADDLWFKAMALLKRTPAVRAEPGGGRDHSLWFKYEESLNYQNETLGKFEGQMTALGRHYGIVPGIDPGAPPAAANVGVPSPSTVLPDEV